MSSTYSDPTYDIPDYQDSTESEPSNLEEAFALYNQANRGQDPPISDLRQPAPHCNQDALADLDTYQPESPSSITTRQSIEQLDPSYLYRQRDAWGDFIKEEEEPPTAEQQAANKHSLIHWSHCYDDSCLIHCDGKDSAGDWPQDSNRFVTVATTRQQ